MNIGIREAMAYFRDASVSTWHKLVGVLAVVYVVSPIDLIPDAIPVIGWLDDIGVIALVATWYLRQISLHAGRAKPQVTPGQPVQLPFRPAP
jgi:uncharacterized membrane protein YkvA (DUF1232 family)